MSNYIITLIWVFIIIGLGTYWHTMRISQKMNKILELLESKDNS